MVDRIKCAEVTMMVVDAVTDALGSNWEVNKHDLDALMKYCEAFDVCADEFDGTLFDVDVDSISHALSISMECSDYGIEIHGKSHAFCQLALCANELKFEQTKDGGLRSTFTFPSLWDLKIQVR